MFLSGWGKLTGGTVIPSGNPHYALRRDHHAVKRRLMTSNLKERKPWIIKPERGCSSALVGGSSTRVKLAQESQSQSRMHRINSAQWKCNAPTSCDWKIQSLIVMVFCQWSSAGLVEWRVLCLKRAYPKRLVVTPS